VIDDRNGHAIGVGLGHDFAHLSVDGGGIRYRLYGSRDGKREGSRKHS